MITSEQRTIIFSTRTYSTSDSRRHFNSHYLRLASHSNGNSLRSSDYTHDRYRNSSTDNSNGHSLTSYTHSDRNYSSSYGYILSFNSDMLRELLDQNSHFKDKGLDTCWCSSSSTAYQTLRSWRCGRESRWRSQPDCDAASDFDSYWDLCYRYPGWVCFLMPGVCMC